MTRPPESSYPLVKEKLFGLPFNYLHAYCVEFAMALHTLYGYSIRALVDKHPKVYNGYKEHVLCDSPTNKLFGIDILGPRKKEEVREYYIQAGYAYSGTLREYKWRPVPAKTIANRGVFNRQAYHVARRWIKDNPQMYGALLGKNEVKPYFLIECSSNFILDPKREAKFLKTIKNEYCYSLVDDRSILVVNIKNRARLEECFKGSGYTWALVSDSDLDSFSWLPGRLPVHV